MAQTQRKKKEEQMRLLVARYTESGQSMAAFCKSSGTVGHVLRYWVVSVRPTPLLLGKTAPPPILAHRGLVPVSV